MAKVLGNITADDDYTHPLGVEENFNESMYFNFFDPENQAGGFLRLGNRANEGKAEMTTTLYCPMGAFCSSSNVRKSRITMLFWLAGCISR